MNKAEVWDLFEQIVYYYPAFTAEAKKATAWHEMLEQVPYNEGLASLKRYASDAENKYPPHPGVLAERPGHNPEGNYVPNAAETARMLEEHCRLPLTASSIIPESTQERMRQLGYKPSGRSQ